MKKEILEDGIKEFFDFIFEENVKVRKDNQIELENGDVEVYDVEFGKLLSRKDARFNINYLKKVLNLYLEHKNIKYGKFTINVV